MPSKKWPLVLQAILEEYLRTGRPVGSQTLVDSYNLDVSSATVRNIMADLTEEGYLIQPHTSAGRVPAPRAFRYYVQHFLDQTSAQTIPEHVRYEGQAMRSRYELLHFLSAQLAQRTDQMAVAMTDDYLVVSGVSNLLNHRDQLSWEVARQIIELAEHSRQMADLFGRLRTDGVRFFIGDENPYEPMRECAVAVARTQIGSWPTYMGVIGPLCMPYNTVLGTIRYLSGMDY